MTSDGLTLVAVGDCILGRPISSFSDLVPITKLLRNADVAIGNFEGTLLNEVDTTVSRRQASGSGWILGSLSVAAELRLLGLDLLSRANNHVVDFGSEGLRVTNAALSCAELVHAGSGNDRQGARTPAILQSENGTVALISATTTFAPESRATAASAFLPAVPGANVLRTTRFTLVSPAQLGVLRAIRRELPAAWIPPHEASDEAELLGIHYRSSGRRGFSYCVHTTDVTEMLEDVRKAAQLFDVVVCSIHSHEPGNWSDEPADFLPRLARDLVDAGANVVIGHGPHRLRGIEMYHGAPIFYSLGNFIFQIQELHPALDDLYAGEFGVEVSELEAVCKGLIFDGEAYFRSVVASVKLGSTTTEVRLTPIELRFDAQGGERGIPRLASPKVARAILEHLRRLSVPFGTNIHFCEGVGVVSGLRGVK